MIAVLDGKNTRCAAKSFTFYRRYCLLPSKEMAVLGLNIEQTVYESGTVEMNVTRIPPKAS